MEKESQRILLRPRTINDCQKDIRYKICTFQRFIEIRERKTPIISTFKRLFH